jgi:hypothetical protein
MRQDHPKEKNLRLEYEKIVAQNPSKDIGSDYLVAIGAEDLETIEIMFEQYPAFQFSNSRSALHIAVDAGKGNSVELLLAKGAIVHATDSRYLKALDVAGRNNMVAIASMILECINNSDERRTMSSNALYHAVIQGNLEVCELSIEAGADVATNERALLAATAFGGHYLIVKLLITKGSR